MLVFEMKRQDKNTKLEHIRGRYGIIVAAVAAIGGMASIPFLCNKKSSEVAASKQKIEVSTNQNSPVTGEIGTQNNYYNTAEKDTTKNKQGIIPKSRTEAEPLYPIPGAKHSAKKEPAAGIYAPNANIVTQNQSGGTNTVIIADSYAQKLEALKNTAPDVSFHLYLRDSFLFADVELKNDVPIEFLARMRDVDGTPYPNLYFSPKTLYPERQRKYTFRIEKFTSGLHDPNPVFKAIITVSIQSIYFGEIKKRSLWKRSRRIYLFDYANQTLTPTNEPASDMIYPDTTKIPWENIIN